MNGWLWAAVLLCYLAFAVPLAIVVGKYLKKRDGR